MKISWLLRALSSLTPLHAVMLSLMLNELRAETSAALSNDIERKVDEQVQSVVSGWAFVEVMPLTELEKARCYSGATVDGSVLYELFPELGFFRVTVFARDHTSEWLYMKILPHGGKVVSRSPKGGLVLDRTLRENILFCASGMLQRDATRVSLTCSSNEEYSLASRGIKHGDGRLTFVRFLISADTKPRLSSISPHDGLWRDLPVKKK